MYSYTAATLLLVLLLWRPVDPSSDSGTQVCGDCEDEKFVVCYFTNWAWYRSEPAKFRPENINATLCTHINYAFAVLDSDTLTVKPSDSWADIDNKFFALVTAFKDKGLKVLLSLGGWNDSAGTKWHRLISNDTARAYFVKHVVEFLKEYNFDGLDLDYEYPACPQGDQNSGLEDDKDNFNKLASELKTVFKGDGLLLTASTSAGKSTIENCYDMATLCGILDWVNLMCYDYHSASDGEVGAQSPLRGTGTAWGIYETLKYYREKLKCPVSKTVLGMSFGAQTYNLVDSSNPKFGAKTSGAGAAGTYSATAGFLSYLEICPLVKNGWKSGFNEVNGSYTYQGSEFISYSTIRDITKKICWVNHYKMKGVMVWTLDYDDFNNVCGCGSYPLLKHINYQLCRSNITDVNCY